MNEICVVELNNLYVSDLIVLEAEEYDAWQINFVCYIKGCEELFVESLDRVTSAVMQVENAELLTREPIQLGKDTLILQYFSNSGVSKVIEDEGEVFCAAF